MNKKSENIKKHLDDIDFRSREQRSKQALPDMKEWYVALHRAATVQSSERLEGQLSMLSSVLWLLLPKKELDEFHAEVKRTLGA